MVATCTKHAIEFAKLEDAYKRNLTQTTFQLQQQMQQMQRIRLENSEKKAELERLARENETLRKQLAQTSHNE